MCRQSKTLILRWGELQGNHKHPQKCVWLSLRIELKKQRDSIIFTKLQVKIVTIQQWAKSLNCFCPVLPGFFPPRTPWELCAKITFCNCHVLSLLQSSPGEKLMFKYLQSPFAFSICTGTYCSSNAQPMDKSKNWHHETLSKTSWNLYSSQYRHRKSGSGKPGREASLSCKQSRFLPV